MKRACAQSLGLGRRKLGGEVVFGQGLVTHRLPLRKPRTPRHHPSALKTRLALPAHPELHPWSHLWARHTRLALRMRIARRRGVKSRVRAQAVSAGELPVTAATAAARWPREPRAVRGERRPGLVPDSPRGMPRSRPRRGVTWGRRGRWSQLGRGREARLAVWDGVPRPRLPCALRCPPFFLSPGQGPALMSPFWCPGPTDLACPTDLVFSLSPLTRCPRSGDRPPGSHALKCDS